MALIPHPLILKIHEAALKAGLDRSTLLTGVDATLVAGLPEAHTRASQVISDLSELNRIERLRDGTVPMQLWLENAIHFAGQKLEAEVFHEALRTTLRSIAHNLQLEMISHPMLQPKRVVPPPQPVKILFLGANPSNLTVRALGAEVREIGGALRKADMGDRFQVEQAWAPRASDLQQCLLEHKPIIVHFSGHGTPDGKIVLEDAQGRSFEVPPNALTRLFQILRDNIRCVVLNACASKPQAEAIAKHIDCVVGMSATITDTHAISFSTAFYRALGFGRTVQEALDLGCNEVAMEGLAEADIPVLLCRAGVRPDDVRLVRSDKAG